MRGCFLLNFGPDSTCKIFFCFLLNIHFVSDALFNEENNCSFNEMSTDEMGQFGRNNHCGINNGPKTWSQQDMENALDALRNHNMSLTKVCVCAD